jgi:hypothetical protein
MASSPVFACQPLFIINNLGTGMSPYAKTKGSRVRMLGVSRHQGIAQFRQDRRLSRMSLREKAQQ